MKLFLFTVVCLFVSSCSLSRPTLQSATGDYRAQSIDDYVFSPEALAESRINAQRLIVLPFQISLQRHFLLKDPIFERSLYSQMSQSFANTIRNWSEQQGYNAEILDIGNRDNRFAAQRVTSTSIRLLNKKSSIVEVPPLSGLIKGLDSNKEKAQFVDSGAAALVMAGSYIGHNKSGGQLIKERMSSGMRYLSSLGRQPLRRPVSGFGKLFVVVLDGDTGRLIWFSDAEARPDSVNQVLAAVLSQFEQEELEQSGSAELQGLD